jgi:pimeloyl-ACP methyl ester carboxylesterase
VLLHGHPRTHTTWHRVAPQPSGSFFVVCPDLRGYGQSTLPPGAAGHEQSSKRAMAGDVVALMRHLGHDRFSVVGHDRGALAAFRTAMDHPDAVERQVVMDGLPGHFFDCVAKGSRSPQDREPLLSSGSTGANAALLRPRLPPPGLSQPRLPWRPRHAARRPCPVGPRLLA